MTIIDSFIYDDKQAIICSFNEQMTSSEANVALFKAVEGKTKAEIEQIKSAYSKILPKILERECQLASKEWLID